MGFTAIDGIDDDLANRLVGEGYLSYDDLSVIEPSDLMEMGGLSAEQVDHIVLQAEELAEEAERAADLERQRQRELRTATQQAGVAAPAQATPVGSPGSPDGSPAASATALDATTAELGDETSAAQPEQSMESAEADPSDSTEQEMAEQRSD